MFRLMTLLNIALMKKHNFYSGPSILPRSVFEEASQAVMDLNGSGLSILEISHRSDAFLEIITTTKSLIRDLLQVPQTHDICFLPGGGSYHFMQVPMNLLRQKAAYLNTGVWASKAIEEATRFGNTVVVASSENNQFRHIPRDYSIPADADYFHITSNNTIYGTQLKQFPESTVPLVCDMSSDILSRRLDVKQFALIYAGAQKNIGAAGCSVVIADRSVLNKTGRNIPTILNYETHFKHDSLFNTPPVFAVYVCMLVMKWLKEVGGVDVIERRNVEKAGLLYSAIDSSNSFYGTVAKEDRSLMNVCFRLKDEQRESHFLELCKSAGIVGVKGHRITGGFRASLYNAMPFDSVKVLADVIRQFDLTS